MWISHLYFFFITWQKTLSFQRSYFMSMTIVYSGEREKKAMVWEETCPFEWSSKTVSKKLAGVLHDHSGCYWRTFPPGPFAMWNGNWIAELVPFGGPAMQADWAGFEWVVPLTLLCVTTLLPHKAADCTSGTYNCYSVGVETNQKAAQVFCPFWWGSLQYTFAIVS